MATNLNRCSFLIKAELSKNDIDVSVALIIVRQVYLGGAHQHCIREIIYG